MLYWWINPKTLSWRILGRYLKSVLLYLFAVKNNYILFWIMYSMATLLCGSDKYTYTHSALLSMSMTKWLFFHSIAYEGMVCIGHRNLEMISDKFTSAYRIWCFILCTLELMHYLYVLLGNVAMFWQNNLVSYIDILLLYFRDMYLFQDICINQHTAGTGRAESYVRAISKKIWFTVVDVP